MGAYKGSYSELGIEPPEPLSILTGRNIVPGSKKKSPASTPKGQPRRPSRAAVAPPSANSQEGE